MTAEAAAVVDAGCQCRVGILRVVVHVTGKTTAAAVARRVERVCPFRLAEMTARTLLAEHRIGDAVAQRLETCRFSAAVRTVDDAAGLANDAATRVHQVAGDTFHPVAVTAAAGALRVCEIARERDQALVGRVFEIDHGEMRVYEGDYEYYLHKTGKTMLVS